MSSDALTPPLYYSSSATPSPFPPPQASSPSAATSAIIVVIVIASAIILSVSIYLLLRFLSRNLVNRRRHHQTHPNDVVLSRHSSTSGDLVASPAHGSALLDSLPAFTFRSVTKGNLAEGDCAVCLSRFEPDDQLRLLPLCCHAFHAACIDAWIVANRTCPLCRSVVVPTDRDVMDKINQSNDPDSLNESNRSRSFRIEMGSVSRRRNGGGGAASDGDRTRSYSIGSFEYIVDQIRDYEVSLVDFADKEHPTSIGATAVDEAIAAEVGSGGGRSGSNNWLRDYVDRLGISSRALSFRSSGRFFSGSSRRSEAAVAAAVVEDLEANRVGEEISELFRWLSGV